jgi:hypothetical protein
VDTLIKIKWWELNTYIAIPRLNPHKHNILVVEMTERYVRDICTKYSGMIGTLKIDSTYRGNTPYYLETSNESIKTSFLEKHFFNPNINSNLELNLFGYPLFRPIKELKAEFNYAVFNRANNDVFVDKKNRFLYYGPTVSGNQIMNSFFPLDSSEMPLICNTLNSVYRYYKTKGFEEIYLAIIPNPVTMINPQLGNYNGLIPKLYAVDSLKMRIIDVYATYAKNPLQYYSRNDTHWSSAGFQTWLDEFNKTLGEISAWPLR